jgi:hypothetical protein
MAEGKNWNSTEAPENVNREQQDEDAQAQSVSDAARREKPLEDSRKASSPDGTEDAQDVVDHIRQMWRSGSLDMDAYRGERSDDDDDGELGPSGQDGEEPRGAP